MAERAYFLEIHCPRCGARGVDTHTMRDLPPVRHCSYCLRNDGETVELTVTRVWVRDPQ
jgi:hypothetical protein